MGGIGTKQKKHRENPIFQRSWGWGVPPRVSKYCYFFSVFSMCFWFLSMGSSPKRLKVFFYVIITWRFILFLSVYGFKWWTDNLKSRQVERVLTKFKGCEPSCRKVQKVAALVGSGGVTIYIYIYIFMCIYSFIYIYISIHIIIIFFNPSQMFPPRCAASQVGSPKHGGSPDQQLLQQTSKTCSCLLEAELRITRVTNGIPMKQGDKMW